MMSENNAKRKTVGSLIDNCLVVSIEGEVLDGELNGFCADLLDKLEITSIMGAVLDFSKVSMLDSYTFNKVDDLTKTMKLMGTAVVWSALSPGVVACLLEFDLDTRGLEFSSTIEEGIKQIKSI